MSQVIAGLYEIGKQIGAGGGGIVYLGRHIRLNKDVVLKADKRKLSARTESLRREVDMLKNLSHTYIPQVYDFVEEDGVVYTVMDYIDGESFDKILERRQEMSQPEIVKWACQLLEALCYLHSQPPYGILHGDIKPANIMLRPDGNVCLIDYNIALALGEDGAVKVGFSRGYASPEHYGADYIKNNRIDASKKISSIQSEEDPDKTLVLDKTSDKTLVLDKTVPLSSDSRGLAGSFDSAGKSKKTIMLDARSDIYSLGATLYHMIGGKRPAQDAREVEPLGTDVCSPAIAAIIRKAIAPQPDMRYQSAEEMLDAFLGLYKSDPRAIHFKKRIAVSAVALSILFFIGGIGTFIGLNQLRQRQNALALSEYSANALAEGDVSGAVSLALQAIPTGKSILDAPVTAQAQKALTDALGVYDLSEGFKALDVLELPSAPFDIVLSPEGTRMAAVYAYEVAVYDLETKQKIAVLPTQNSALSDAVFVDEDNIIYAGSQGVTSYNVRERKNNWTGGAGTTLSLSADGSRLAAVDRDGDYADVYQVSDGRKISECSFDGLHLPVPVNDVFADAGGYIFSLNQNGSMLAVSFYNGGLYIFDVAEPGESLIIFEESEFVRFEGGFHKDYFAYAADKNGQSVFGLVNVKKGEYIGGYDSQDGFLLQADEQGICLASGSLLAEFDPDTYQERELAYTNNVTITGIEVAGDYAVVATDDKCVSFYDGGSNLMSTETCSENCDFIRFSGKYAVLGNRNEPSMRVLKLENHGDSLLLSYDAGYEHDEARISMDGQTVMLFNYEQFAVYHISDGLIAQVELPDPDHIYDQQFVREGNDSWLEVIWYDGVKRCYDARDGRMISERQEEPPSKDLYEEFYTDRYRITSPLHSAAQVYDAKTGKPITTLEKDSYLTYVTQVRDYLITEYVSAAGERYGLLLDKDLQTLAYLPGLCDITDGYLIFDYDSGNLRRCPLYSIQELIDLGESYLTEEQ